MLQTSSPVTIESPSRPPRSFNESCTTSEGRPVLLDRRPARTIRFAEYGAKLCRT